MVEISLWLSISASDCLWTKDSWVTSPGALACLVLVCASVSVMETNVIYWGVRGREGTEIYQRYLRSDRDILHQHLTFGNILFLVIKYFCPCKMKYLCSLWLWGKHISQIFGWVSSTTKWVDHWYYIICWVWSLHYRLYATAHFRGGGALSWPI